MSFYDTGRNDEDVDEPGELVRCPYCGRLAEEGKIERPADYCHHDCYPEESTPEPEGDGECPF